ncbi:MAG: hypothetical protein ACRC9R_01160, partial [Enterovibrio sp.]
LFEGVLNWAIAAADALAERMDLHSGGGKDKNTSEARCDKASQGSSDQQNCTIITKLKDKNNNNENNEPPKTFFERFFKENAQEVQSLQLAARLGRITASGAKKLIKLHLKHGYKIATNFYKYLRFVIAKEHDKPKPEPGSTNTCQKQAQTPQKPQRSAFTMPDDIHVKMGIAEYYRDEIGRVHVRWLEKEKIEDAVTATTDKTGEISPTIFDVFRKKTLPS